MFIFWELNDTPTFTLRCLPGMTQESSVNFQHFCYYGLVTPQFDLFS